MCINLASEVTEHVYDPIQVFDDRVGFTKVRGKAFSKTSKEVKEPSTTNYGSMVYVCSQMGSRALFVHVNIVVHGLWREADPTHREWGESKKCVARF